MHLSQELQPVLLKLATAEAAAARPVVRPEVAELQRAGKERERIAAAASAAQMAVDDMELEIRRIQEDQRKLERRKKDNIAQLGAATDVEVRRDLQHDLSTTEARLTDLRYELKEAHNEIAALRNNREVHGAQLDEATRKLEAAQRAVDALPEETPVDTGALRAQLPADLLEVYDNVGAASFNSRTCGGCFLQLPPTERAEVMAVADDELPTCPNLSLIHI